MKRLSIATMKKVLLGTEATLHRGGWDKDPYLFALDRFAPQSVGAGLIPIAVMNPPGEFVYYLGQRYLENVELPEITVQSYPHFYGVAAVLEAWQAKPDMTEEEHQLAHLPGRGYADQDGAREVRMVMAIDLYGQAYFVRRIRGEKPEAFDAGDGEPMLEGQIIEGLRLMTLACAQLLPDNTDYLAALNDLAIRTYVPIEE